MRSTRTAAQRARLQALGQEAAIVLSVPSRLDSRGKRVLTARLDQLMLHIRAECVYPPNPPKDCDLQRCNFLREHQHLPAGLRDEVPRSYRDGTRLLRKGSDGWLALHPREAAEVEADEGFEEQVLDRGAHALDVSSGGLRPARFGAPAELPIHVEQRLSGGGRAPHKAVSTIYARVIGVFPNQVEEKRTQPPLSPALHPAQRSPRRQALHTARAQTHHRRKTTHSTRTNRQHGPSHRSTSSDTRSHDRSTEPNLLLLRLLNTGIQPLNNGGVLNAARSVVAVNHLQPLGLRPG